MAKQDSETKTVILVVGALLVFTAGIFLGQFLAREKKTEELIVQATPQPIISPPGRGRPTPVPKSIEEAGGVGVLPVKGDRDAPVTIIEFSDFQCPFCKRFFDETLPKIQEEYIAKGKVKYFYRDYPLSFHQYAQKAAEAARCANDQNEFWDYHDKIFENQKTLSLESLKKWAVELGLDKTRFDNCLDGGKFEEAVKKDFADGQAAGVRGTPAFFINDRFVSGAQPFENFKKIIDEELGQI